MTDHISSSSSCNSDPHPVDPADPDPDAPLIPAFAPVPVRPRRDGWSAERQRTFIQALAETGCVVTACREAGMKPRSVYRLAARPDAAAFAEAWDRAAIVASRRLLAYAFEFSTHGVTETVTNKDGEVVAERRRPSERILLYLLSHLDSHRFGRAAAVHPNYRYAPSLADSRESLGLLLDMLEDVEEDLTLPFPGADPDGDLDARPRA